MAAAAAAGCVRHACAAARRRLVDQDTPDIELVGLEAAAQLALAAAAFDARVCASAAAAADFDCCCLWLFRGMGWHSSWGCAQGGPAGAARSDAAAVCPAAASMRHPSLLAHTLWRRGGLWSIVRTPFTRAAEAHALGLGTLPRPRHRRARRLAAVTCLATVMHCGLAMRVLLLPRCWPNCTAVMLAR